jgi:CHAD domain-containing protein
VKRTTRSARLGLPASLRIFPLDLPRRPQRRPEPGRVAAAPWVDHLRRHLLVAREGTDPEGVHQVRVACARLLVWLELAERSALRDDLRWLRRAAGKVRDLDVLLLSSPPEPFASHLRTELRRRREALRRALDDSRLAALLAALDHLPPFRAEEAEAGLARIRRRARRRASRAAEKLDAASLHALRRALRKLHFAEEWLGRETPRRLRALQRALGELNDAVAAQRALAAFRGRAALRPYRAGLEARAEGARREATRLLEEAAPSLEA